LTGIRLDGVARLQDSDRRSILVLLQFLEDHVLDETQRMNPPALLRQIHTKTSDCQGIKVALVRTPRRKAM
jgi:hypothetical protein